MRILVVNAFGNSAKGRKEALIFKQFVQSTFDNLKLHIHMAFRKPNELGDYIYEGDSEEDIISFVFSLYESNK